MTWVRVDDKALQHPKLLSVGPEGVCLWLAGLCHCNSFATDGVIRKEFVEALYPPFGRGVARRVAARLVAVGLWKDAGTSFEVHDYEHYQAEAMKEEADARAAVVEARRKRDRERKRADRAEKREGVRDLSARTSATVPDGQPEGQSADGPSPVPRARDHAPAGVSRPGPARPDLPDQDLGSSESFGEVVAVLDRSRPKAPPPPPIELVKPPNGDPRVGSRDASTTWNRVMAMPNAGIPGVGHSHDLWRVAFEEIAAACNGVEGRPSLALQVATEWFWLGPDGPVQAARVPRSSATPEVFAKRIGRDLESALAWWAKRKQQAQPQQQSCEANAK